MRILATDQFGEMGGAQFGFVEAIQGFAHRGWEVHAAIPEGPLAGRLVPHCASIQHISCGPFTSVRKGPSDVTRFAWQAIQQKRTFAALATKCDVQAIYVNGPRVLPAAALAAGERALMFHAHSVVTQRWVARLENILLSRGGVTVLASSHFVARSLNTPHVQVVYNGIAGSDRFRTRSQFRRIGVLGRIAPEKDQLTFVRAARQVAQVRPDLQFLLGGAPVFASADYLDLVRNEASGETQFLGWIDTWDFLERIDLLVVPSAGIDANPRVIPEAFSAGVPVIAFASGGVPELIEDGVTGILVKEHSPRALAGAILGVISDPGRLQRICSQARETWQQRFTLPRFQSEVCDALERAVFGCTSHSIRASATA